MDSRQNRRRMADIQALQQSGALVDVEEEDNRLICMLYGPADTPYAGGRWRVAISLPKDYPFASPSVGFVDKIYHPNVDLGAGAVCLNALNQEWTPIYQLTNVVDTLLPQLLTYPNPDDPLNHEAAKLLIDEKTDDYGEQVRRYPGYTDAAVADA